MLTQGYGRITLASLMVVGLYLSTVTSITDRWFKFDETFGHGWLVLLVVIGLFYHARSSIAKASVRPCYLALLPLLAMEGLWLIGSLTDILIFQQAVIPAMIWLLILLFGGKQLAAISLFPIGFLYFAIPLWDHLVEPLVAMTVAVANLVLSHFPTPVFIEGHRIHIPSGSIFVADGCSGIRYLIIATATATLLTHLNGDSWPRRIALITLGAGLGILANWIRVISLVLIGHATEMHSKLLYDHEAYGFVIFGVLLLVLIPLATKPSPHPRAIPQERQQVPPESPFPAPKQQKYAPLLAGFLALTAAPGLHQWVTSNVGEVTSIPSGQVSDRSQSRFHLIGPDTPFVEAREHWIQSNGHDVLLSVYKFSQPRIGTDYIPYNRLLDTKLWSLVEQGTQNTRSGSGRSMDVLQFILKRRDSNDRWLAWLWFDIFDTQTSSALIAKLLEIPAMFARDRNGYVITLATRCRSDCRTASHSLEQMALGSGDRIDQFIRAAKANIRSDDRTATLRETASR